MKNEAVRLCRGRLVAAGLALLFATCSKGPTGDVLFSQMPSRLTGVSFENLLRAEPDFNILEYLYFYDGGGIAIGDINNDGLPDLYFTANQGSNKLYLNKGDFRFEDITDASGTGGSPDAWSKGVTMADVNGDGLLDIHVSQVQYRDRRGHNLLYINGGDNTFTEQAAAYGLNFEGLSTQAAFFDYDLDGDLDMYLLNHSVHTRESFVQAWRRVVDAPRVGDRLYRNDGGWFTNVTSDAGIYSSALGYGLGLVVSDINHDGWPDIYVGNDFHENDYLYINNTDGTFSEVLQRVIGHTSRSTMGVDIGDVNNDVRVDIAALDMLPPDIATYRASGGPDADDLARIKRNFGYAPQVARNTLQIHRGKNREGLPLFSEIGAYAGIHATDWSWAGLLVDLDHDGWKDLYVTNGIPGRPNDLDYIEHVSEPRTQQILYEGTTEEQLAVTRKMPPLAIANIAFRNNGDATFADQTREWGLGAQGFSNGAAYGDLDGDGDVDLAVNNTNAPALLYRNNMTGNHSLRVRLQGDGANTTGVGAKVILFTDGTRLYQEQMPTRGFQSSVAHTLVFGLGSASVLDSLLVIWPGGGFQRLEGVEADTLVVLRQQDAGGSYRYVEDQEPPALFQEFTPETLPGAGHRENEYEDYDAQPLIPHRLSTEGPALAVADVNGDGLDDFYLGGAHGQEGVLFIQRRGGEFSSVPFPDNVHEDVDAAFLDAEGDGDMDLYVVSGGGQHASPDAVLEDRLYVNDGSGDFSRSHGSIPGIRADGCCVAPADYDGDGDTDLFVGSRSVPGAYGVRPASRLLENDGAGSFTDVTQAIAPALLAAGMVTGCAWADVTGSGAPDLVLVGEWMPITILTGSGGVLEDTSLPATGGWWTSILLDDVDADGDIDLIAGNLGVNTTLSAPLDLITHDFDSNGSVDPIIVEQRDGRSYTWARRDPLLKQLPGWARRLPTYASYAEATLENLFEPGVLALGDQRRVDTFASVYLENTGAGEFRRQELPRSAQWSPVTSILAHDFTGDGHMDVLTAGNFFGVNTVQGRYDADYGTLLVGNGEGSFTTLPMHETGLRIQGEVRAMRFMRLGGHGRAVLVARNNDAPLILTFPSELGTPTGGASL